MQNNQYGRYQKAYNNYIAKKNQLVDIESVQSFMDTYKDSSASTQHLAKTSIKQALENMTDNNVDLLAISKAFKSIKTKKADKAIKQDKVLDEMTMFAVLRQATLQVGLIVELLAKTGLRVSELLNIKLSHVRCSKKHCLVKVLGKGKKERSVYVSHDLIRRCKDVFDGKTWLCETKSGKQIIRNNINKQLQRLSKKLGIHLTPHSLRHTFATSKIVKEGKTLKAVSNYLGHSTTAITADMYLHDSLKPEDVL